MSAVAVTAPSARRAAGGHRMGRVLVRLLYRPVTLDAEHVPARGGVLLAVNHTGILDGPLVYALAPRPVHFLVKSEAFHGTQGWVLNRCGQIPLDRGGVDRAALQAALAVLHRGGAVGVFPEGARGRGDVAVVQEGVSWLAMVGNVPVVPVACLGTRRPGAGIGRPPPPGQRVAVVFGEPVHLVQAPELPRSHARRELTEQLRLVLAGHVRASAERTGIPLYDDGLHADLENAP